MSGFIFFVACGLGSFVVMYFVVLPFAEAWEVRTRIAGYKRRAAAEAEYDRMAKARGRVVVAGNVHCPHGCIFPDDGRIRCALCEEESRQKE